MADTAMDGNAVREIERLAKAADAAVIKIGGREYATTPIFDPRRETPLPKFLGLATLASFVEYARQFGSDDGVEARFGEEHTLLVHVEGPTTVSLWTGLFGEFNQRAMMAQAKAVVPEIRLGTYYGIEDFNILLLGSFENAAQRADVAQIIGCVEAGTSVQTDDDGISQSVQLKMGINRAKRTTKDPFVLRPYCTFSEIAQPDRPFVLRMRGEANTPQQAALFECDGGRWRLDVIKRLKDWLAGELPGWTIIG